VDVVKLLKTEERTAIERWVQANARVAYLGEGRSLARVLGKYLMHLPTDDASLVPHLLLDGYWEMWITMAMARHVRLGWHCLDVGAHVGYYTLLLADIVGEQGSVQAWELQPDLAECITRSVHMNGMQDRVRVVNSAASEQRGYVAAVPLSEPWERGSVGVRVLEDSEVTLQSRTCYRLDDPELCEDPSTVNFVKIDCEGHEPEIWRGLSGILEASPAVQVLLEFTPRLYADARGFLREIQDQGFSLQRVDFNAELQPAEPEELLSTSSMEMLWLGR